MSSLVVMANVTEVKTHWKDGDGDPFNGGLFGYDSDFTNDNGDVLSRCVTRPATAVTIAEAEYDTLFAAFEVEWATRATGGQAWLDQQLADEQALKDSAKANLVAGNPLTDAEAAIVSGGV